MGFDPLSIAAMVSATTALAGTGVAIAGQMNSAKAAKQDAYYKAQVAANNAKIANQNANWTLEAGETQAFNKGLQTRGIVGDQKAAQGASNIDVNTGSAAATRIATQELGHLDQQTILGNAAKSAYGFQVQGQNDTAQSQLEIQKGKYATQAGEIGALGSFLSGISSTAGALSNYGIQSRNSAASANSGTNQNVGSNSLGTGTSGLW